MPRLEKTLTTQILRRLNALQGCHAVKTHGSIYQSGWPDIIGCHRGQFFAIEVKIADRQPTKLQQVALETWKQVGAITGWCSSVDGALSILIGENNE